MEFYSIIEEYIDTEQFDKILALENDVNGYTSLVDSLSADIHSVYGETHLILGDFDKSIYHFERALNIREQLDPLETQSYSNVLYNLVTVYLESGDFLKARKSCEKLLKVDAKIHGEKSIAYLESLLYYGDVLIESSFYDDAYKLLRGHLKKVDDDFDKAVVEIKLGDVLSLLGNYESSEEYIAKASETFASLNDTINFELSQSTLGLNLINKGKYPQAERVFIQMRDHLLAIEGTEQYVNDASSNLAIAQMALGRSSDAIEVYKDLLENDSVYYGVEHPKYITSLLNIGTAYHDIKNYALAIKSLNRALELTPNVYGSDSETEATLLNNIANAYRDNGQTDLATQNFEKARKLFAKNEGKTSANYATATYNLAKLELITKGENAEKLLLDALKIRERTLGKEHPQYAEVTNHLGIYYWQKQDLKKAKKYFDDTFINFFEQIRLFFPVLSEEEKTKFYLEKLKPTFEQYNSLAEAMYTSDPTILESLYNYQLRTKGVIMMATERMRRNIYQSNDSILIAEYESWKAMKEHLAKLYSNNDPRQNFIDSIQSEANNLEKSLVNKSSDFSKVYNLDIPTWEKVQSKLKQGESAVEIIRYRVFDPEGLGKFNRDVHYWILAIDTDSEYPEPVVLTRGSLMEGRYLSNYRNSIRYQIKDNFTYKELWEPLSKALNKRKKVYISPDGVYNQVNLSTLVNPESGEFLIKEIDLQEVTSTRDLLKELKSSDQSSSKYFIGFPTYTTEGALASNDKKERSLRGGTRGGTRGGLRGANSGYSETRGLRGGLLRYMRSGEGIAVLPGTKTEVEEITKLYSQKNEETENLLSEKANETLLKSVKSPEILHIATHGYFLENIKSPDFGDTKQYYQNPLLRAGLILAGAEDFLLTGSNSIDDEDGILTAYEAMNMDLNNTDLVVLSACETGLGEVSNGEGVYGLQRAFKIAGVRYIVMSMWNVDDDATQRLMTLFYQNLTSGQEKYTAFREAQLALMDEYNEPFYWGAFKIVGD